MLSRQISPTGFSCINLLDNTSSSPKICPKIQKETGEKELKEVMQKVFTTLKAKNIPFDENHLAAFVGYLDFFTDPSFPNEFSLDPAGYTPLHYAAVWGHQEIVAKLFGVNKQRDPQGRDALLLAARYGHAHLVEWLLENGCPIDTKDHQRQTALHYAAVWGHQEIVAKLFGINDRRDRLGRDALLLAARYGHAHLVQWLLAQGCPIDTKDHQGHTGLLLACLSGHQEVLEVFLAFRDQDAVKKVINSPVPEFRTIFDLIFPAHPRLVRRLINYSTEDEQERRHLYLGAAGKYMALNAHLEGVDLSSLQLGDELLAKWLSIFKRVNYLEKIDLSFNALTQASSPTLIALCQRQQLTDINLSGNFLGGSGFFASAMVNLAKSLEGHGSLRQLSLVACSLDDGDVPALRSLLIKNRSLRKLDLRKNPAISAQSWYFLRRCEAVIHDQPEVLETIDLSSSCLGPASGPLLVSFLARHPHLSGLHLDDNKLGRQGWSTSPIQALAKALETNRSLKRLWLTGCDLQDADLKALGKMLQKNQTLGLLCLRENPALSQEALREFLMTLEHAAHGLGDLYIDNQQDPTLCRAVEQALRLPPREVSFHPTPTIFKKALEVFKQSLPEGATIQPLDEGTKQTLLKRWEQKQELSPQEALNLMNALLQEGTAQTHSATKAMFELLLNHERFDNFKNLWNTFNNSPELKEASTNRRQYFEATLQRKLSMYWVAVSCIETSLISLANDEVDEVLKSLKFFISLVGLLPGTLSHHVVGDGVLGILNRLQHSVYELVEHLHVIDFITEIPFLHSVVHHVGEKLTEVKNVSQKHMLKNILEKFMDFDSCNEQCLGIAKAISYRYSLIEEIDTLEEVAQLADATANMILDFWKMGFSPPSHPENPEEDQEAVLNWLFFASWFYYRKQNPIGLRLKGQAICATELYTLPGLEFCIQDQQKKELVVRCDLSIINPDHDINIKTNSTVFGYRKGSALEAGGFKEFLESQLQAQVKRQNKKSTITFHLAGAIAAEFDIKSIKAFVCPYLTKTQRLKCLEDKVNKYKEESESDKEDIKRLRASGDESCKKIKDLESKVTSQDKVIQDNNLVVERLQASLVSVGEILMKYVDNQVTGRELAIDEVKRDVQILQNALSTQRKDSKKEGPEKADSSSNSNPPVKLSGSSHIFLSQPNTNSAPLNPVSVSVSDPDPVSDPVSDPENKGQEGSAP